MIDRLTIDRIFDATRIDEVVGEFVALKKRGANFIGCCPFHNERTPSFSVNPARNIYKCFGCGKAGNAVNFLMEHEHFSYPDALRYLAKKYGISVEEKEYTPEEKIQSDRRESLMIISAYAARLFHDNLFNTNEGTAIGLSYFKERGFRVDTIKKFELGFSLETRDAFTQRAIKDGYKDEFLIETGLSIKGERGLFDRFAGRVMFPVHSLSGKVIAFGGRTLKADSKAAKYLNSPESDIYSKSKVLYGIFQAKNSIVKKDKCFLVEGYTDVLSMNQAGVENVVASSGTALTVEQIHLIKRFTPNITVLYDGDAAGINASLRGVDLILQEDMNVKVLLLPKGEDPDSFARSHNASKLEEYILANETDFITFKAKILLDDAKNDPVKRSKLITDVVQSISLIPQAIKRSVYLKECARMFEMDERMLAETADVMRKKQRQQTQAPPLPHPTTTTPTTTTVTRGAEAEIKKSAKTNVKDKEPADIELELIRLMLRYGNKTLLEADESSGEPEITVAGFIISELCADELELQQPLLLKIFEEYRQVGSDNIKNVTEMYFLQHPDPEISRLAAGFEPKYELSKIHNRNGAIVKTEENTLRDVTPVQVLAYKSKRVMMRIDEITKAMQQAECEKNIEQLEVLCRQHKELSNVKKTLGLTLGKRIYI